LTSTSAPPGIPRLMAASVWMKFSKVLMPNWFAAQCADDAAGHGLAHAKRIADSQHWLAHLKLVRLPGRSRTLVQTQS
jgi:hypothetical protein